MKKKLVVLSVLTLMMACTAACSNEKPVADVSDTENVTEGNTVPETETVSEEATENVTEKTAETADSDVTVSTEEETEKFDISSISTFEVTSENLTDGVWDDIITDTKNGENLSPELSWESVEGANYYNIYMLDELAGNWMHWRVEGLNKAGLEAGVCDRDASDISDNSENEVIAQYVGPYPPGGTHTYTVFVLALKEMPEKKGLGDFDASWNDINEIAEILNGNQDNLVGVGKVSGTYTPK